MAGNALVDFFADIGFNVDDKGLQKFESTMKDVGAQVAILSGVITAAAAAVSGFVFKMTSGMDELHDFAKLNNVNVEQLQRLQYAAEIMDSSAQAVTSSIGALNGMIGQAASGIGRGALIMRKYGFDVRDANGNIKDTALVLEEVRQKMHSLSRAEQISMADRLGIDRTLIPMLTDVTGKFSDLIEESNDYIVAAKDMEAASTLMDDGFKRLKMQFMGTARVIVVKLLPVFTMVMKKIQQFLKTNKKSIEEGIAKGLKIVLNLFGALFNVISALINIGSALANLIGGWHNALVLVGAALGVILAYKIGTWVYALTLAMRGLSIATLAAVWPYVLIGVGIIAFIAIIEDLIVWLKGGESAFASFWQGLADDIKLLKPIGDWFKWWIDLYSEGMGKVSSFLGLTGASVNVEPKQSTINQAGKSIVANDNRKIDITISSPDPHAAGKSVTRELANTKKSSIRNGQGATVY